MSFPALTESPRLGAPRIPKPRPRPPVRPKPIPKPKPAPKPRPNPSSGGSGFNPSSWADAASSVAQTYFSYEAFTNFTDSLTENPALLAAVAGVTLIVLLR